MRNVEPWNLFLATSSPSQRKEIEVEALGKMALPSMPPA